MYIALNTYSIILNNNKTTVVNSTQNNAKKNVNYF